MDAYVNQISGGVVDSAIEVHTALGPGLLESAYEICLGHELRKRGFSVESQKTLPLTYDGITLDAGYRLDLLVEDTVIVELKAVEEVSNLHRAQILSYLKLSRRPLGLLMNFNVKWMKDGIERFAN
jgi:GxxExxY protein